MESRRSRNFRPDDTSQAIAQQGMLSFFVRDILRIHKQLCAPVQRIGGYIRQCRGGMFVHCVYQPIHSFLRAAGPLQSCHVLRPW